MIQNSGGVESFTDHIDFKFGKLVINDMQQLLDQPSYIRHKFIQHTDGHNNDIIKEEDHHQNDDDAEPSFDAEENATKEEESKVADPEPETQEHQPTEVVPADEPAPAE